MSQDDPGLLSSQAPLEIAAPETLSELLEWRQSLRDWGWRPSWECCEELRRICAPGKLPALGYRCDGFGSATGELLPIPREDFFEFRLHEDPGGNHGQLSDTNLFTKWRGVRFPQQTKAVWLAALYAGELGAPAATVRSLATAPPPHVGVAGKRRRGPAPGTIRRHDYSALFPELERLMTTGLSLHGAAEELANGNKIPGSGTPTSRAKALARAYGAQKKLAETR